MSAVADRYPVLSALESPADIRRLSLASLAALATELRAFLCHNGPEAGTRAGHVAAGLGSVELAIAVHYVFDTPADRIVWDSGPQAYPHKVLTGRRDRLQTLGQSAGLQPFPQRAESEYDAFGAGHCGTSISAALGMAIAAARLGEQRRVVAIIGDGGLSAGMAFEALNHAGSLPASDLLIILNDNDPAARGGGGALSSRFARVLSGRVYAQLRAGGKKVLRQMPTVLELARRSEKHLKGMVLPGSLFEELGFNYIGPLDGHDIGTLVATLRNLKKLHGPQFLHVVTRNDSAGMPVVAARHSYSEVLGQWLCDIAAADPAIIAITPAMREESGLCEFAQRFPDRFFDVSVAQQHALTFAAGLAAEGFKPVVAIHSTFLQRAYDQIIHDVALQRLPVVLAVDGAGLVGCDGATHQGSYDLSYLRCIPNLTIMAPADENECRQMLYTASTLPGPAVVRFPRTHGPGVRVTAAMSVLPVGRAKVCREGQSGLALLVFGALLGAAGRVAERLDATLVNMRFVKPLDQDLITALAARHRALVTVEDNVLAGGAGSAVAEALAARGVHSPLLRLGIPDRFIEHGSRESGLAATGLDARGLSDSIEPWWELQNPGRRRAAGV